MLNKHYRRPEKWGTEQRSFLLRSKGVFFSGAWRKGTAESDASPAPLQRGAATRTAVSGRARARRGDSQCHRICGKAAQEEISQAATGSSSFLPSFMTLPFSPSKGVRACRTRTPPRWALCLCLSPSCAVTAGYMGHSTPWAPGHPASQPHAEPRQAQAGRCAGVRAPLGASREQPRSSSSPSWSHLTRPWEEMETLPGAAGGPGLAAAAEALLQGLSEVGFAGERELPSPTSSPLALLKQR